MSPFFHLGRGLRIKAGSQKELPAVNCRPLSSSPLSSFPGASSSGAKPLLPLATPDDDDDDNDGSLFGWEVSSLSSSSLSSSLDTATWPALTGEVGELRVRLFRGW
jgi:hypothetical protein